jgi:hypothetical protein
MQQQTVQPIDIVVRPALEADLPAADCVIRVAFGTAAGVPDPEGFFGDVDAVLNRWRTEDAETGHGWIQPARGFRDR